MPKKTRKLPPFTGYPPRSPSKHLARFIFDYEPATIAESRRFRRALVRVLNSTQGICWVYSE